MACNNLLQSREHTRTTVAAESATQQHEQLQLAQTYLQEVIAAARTIPHLSLRQLPPQPQVAPAQEHRGRGNARVEAQESTEQQQLLLQQHHQLLLEQQLQLQQLQQRSLHMQQHRRAEDHSTTAQRCATTPGVDLPPLGTKLLSASDILPKFASDVLPKFSSDTPFTLLPPLGPPPSSLPKLGAPDTHVLPPLQHQPRPTATPARPALFTPLTAEQQAQKPGQPSINFAKIYNFLGSLFEPTTSNHLERLGEMSSTDREAVLLLMHNLGINLANQYFREQHSILLQQYRTLSVGVPQEQPEAKPAATFSCGDSPEKAGVIAEGVALRSAAEKVAPDKSGEEDVVLPGVAALDEPPPPQLSSGSKLAEAQALPNCGTQEQPHGETHAIEASPPLQHADAEMPNTGNTTQPGLSTAVPMDADAENSINEKPSSCNAAKQATV
eukprot:TRINITY_DN5461_c0_g1_i1.p1 TRINITY_DN5461_c0_g1~~TRINITY_DN5461_c0_g1_i1.p1  ORF type:complete len:500 (+),score=154.59 TRINITY_DN5461_c0_g1_i1:178-1500(+)